MRPPDLLEVVDQNVDVLQHLRRGAAILGHVEGVDGDARLGVGLVHDLLARLRRPPDAVLGGQQGDQLQILVLRDQIDVRGRATGRSRCGW